MPELVIEWEVSDQNLTQELVSKDKRWHISKTQKGSAEPQFFLSQWDLLLTPHGTGNDYLQCFETFIADCDKFSELVCTVKAEAEKHLEALRRAAKEVSCEN